MDPPPLSERVRSLKLPDHATGHRGGSSWLPWILCAVFAAIACGLGFARFGEDKDYQDYLELKKTVGDPVAALKAQNPETPLKSNEPAKGQIALSAKGNIIPISLIQVSPKVGGMVIKLYITEGMRVPKDFLLAELEDIDYKADYDRAVANVGAAQRRHDELWKYRDVEIKQAEADMADSKAQRDQLYVDYKRSEQLKNSNALPAKEFEQAESAYKSMDFRTERLKLAYDMLIRGPRDERIAAAKAEWDQAKADLVKAEWRLGNTKVKAPIEGTILTKKAEEGNMVNPSAFSNGLSASLCEMADLANMEVEVPVAERDIGKVFDNQACKLYAEAFPERVYQGIVTRRMPTADRSRSVVPVRVKIFIPHEEAGQYLRPEMGAFVTFLNEKANSK